MAAALSFNYFGIPRKIAKIDPNLYHSLKSNLPIRTRCPSVITIYDLIFLRFPQYYPTFWKAYWKNAIKSAATRATAIVTISENSARDMHELLSFPRET